MTVYDLFSMIVGNGDFSIYTRQYATNNMKYVLLAYGQVNEVSFSTVPYAYCEIAYISVTKNGLNIILDDKYIFDKNIPRYTYVKSRYFYECELIGLRNTHETKENSMKEADATESRICLGNIDEIVDTSVGVDMVGNKLYLGDMVDFEDKHKDGRPFRNTGAIRKIGKRLVIDVIDKDSTVLKSTRLPNFFQYCRAYKID